LILGNATGASWWVGARLPGGFWIGFGMILAIGILVVATWSRAGVLTLSTKHAEPPLHADPAV
jgi:hypothetical protein